MLHNLRNIVIILFFSTSISSIAQVKVNNNALDLAQTIIGEGANVVDAKLTCSGNSNAIFNIPELQSQIGYSEGIVLSTGNTNNIFYGQAKASGISCSENNSYPGLAQLTKISNLPNEDACYLDIDIKPIGNFLEINYFFASEEYPEYVGKYYNDLFGFFVSGPNPLGGTYNDTNIAVLSGTVIPVTVNTINNGIYNTGPCINCNYYIDNLSDSVLAFDGKTKNLKARIDLIPCESYRFRLAIADVKDGNFDSGVFFKKKGILSNTSFDIVGLNKLCKGQSTIIHAESNTWGTYSWSTGDTGVYTEANELFGNEYTCYFTACGSTVSKSFNVQFIDSLNDNFSYEKYSFCKNEGFYLPTLKGTGTFSCNSNLLAFDSINGGINIASSPVGNYIINYHTASNLCPSLSSRIIRVNALPEFNLSYPNEYCSLDSLVPLRFSLNAGEQPYAVKIWNANNFYRDTLYSNNDSANLLNPTSFQIKITDKNLCSSDLRSFTINKNTARDFYLNASEKLCFNESIKPVEITLVGKSPYQLLVNNSDTITSSDSVLIYLPSNIGTYNFQLISDTNLCTNTKIKSLKFYYTNPFKVSCLEDTTVCPGNYIHLNPKGALSYKAFSSEGSACSTDSLLLTKSGLYFLIGLDENGCKDTVLMEYEAYPIPLLNISIPSVCDGMLLKVINASDSLNSIIKSFNWFDVNDSISYQTWSPYINYNECGEKNIMFELSTINDCVVKRQFTPNVDCLNNLNVFISDSIKCDTEPILFITDNSNRSLDSSLYRWDFGDGTIKTGLGINQIEHKFNKEGSYHTTLTIETKGGCKDSSSKQITIKESPNAKFSSSIACEEEEVTIYNGSVYKGGANIRYYWDFNNDGLMDDTSFTVKPRFLDPGVYRTVLYTAANNGCKDSISNLVYIKPKPTINFSFEGLCQNEESIFKNESKINDESSSVQYQWDINGDLINEDVATKTRYNFTESKTYNITLNGISNYGCSNELKKEIFINPQPQVIAEAIQKEVCEGAEFQLLNASYVSSPSLIYSSNWLIDSLEINTANPKLRLPIGVYSVKLKVATNFGCSNSKEFVDLLKVYPNPKSTFTVSPESPSTLLNEIVISNEARSDSYKNCIWKYSPAVEITFESNSHLDITAKDSGAIIITQILETEFGCIDSSMKRIYVKKDFSFYIPNSFSPNGDALNEVFIPTGEGLDMFKEYELEIHDRWNGVVFKSNSLEKGWNGSYKDSNEQVPIGTYVYNIVLTDYLGRRYEYNGQVNLIR